jgi:hypothetical protein
MQTSEGTQAEPPLLEIDVRGQTFEVYVVSTDAVAEGAALATATALSSEQQQLCSSTSSIGSSSSEVK